MAATRTIKLGLILHGVGRTWDDWRHPDRDVTASTNFKFYTEQARLAGQGKFHFLAGGAISSMARFDEFGD